MVSLAEMIEEVRQEIRMRERVYPRLVASRKMRKETAELKLERMRALLSMLGEMPDH